MPEITKEQRDLARHALGLDGRNKTTYRNHFVLGKNSDGYEAWCDLESKGLAHHRDGTGSQISGEMDVFWCTRELALSVRNNDEHLAEDFRE